MHKTSKKNRRIINGILGVLAVIWFVPVIFAVLNMFKGQVEYNMGSFWALPEGNEFMANVSYIRDNAKIFQGMLSSLLYSSCGAVFAVILGTMSAYAIAHLKIRHRITANTAPQEE